VTQESPGKTRAFLSFPDDDFLPDAIVADDGASHIMDEFAVRERVETVDGGVCNVLFGVFVDTWQAQSLDDFGVDFGAEEIIDEGMGFG